MKEKVSLGVTMLVILIFVLGIVLGGQFHEIIFHPRISPPSLEETIEVSLEELVEYLNSKPFKDKTRKRYFQIISDKTFYLPKLSAFKRFLRGDNLDKYKHTGNTEAKERFDCDDFAHALKGRAAENGFPLAVIWIFPDEKAENGHVANLFFTKENGKLEAYFVEARTDKIIPVSAPIKGKIAAVLL